MDKKGITLRQMYPIVLALVLIGAVLGIGVFILAQLRTGVATEFTGTDNTLNISDMGDGTGVAVSDASKTNFELAPGDFVLTFTNGTSMTVITDYNVTGVGAVSVAGAYVEGAANGTLCNATYNYYYDESNSPEESITTTITGVATFADWIAIIVVVIAAAIILGVVLSSFGGGRTGI